MLIISEDQFLAELAQSSSKSISISETLHPSSVTPDKILEEKTNKDTELPSFISEIPVEEYDRVKLESHMYDDLRKPKGIPNIPNEVKAIAGALGILDNQANTSEALGISKDTVGNLVNDNHKNSEVSERKLSVVQTVRENIVGKIADCIQFLEIARETPKKELLATAESLSRIHRNIGGVAEGAGGNGVQFIFYAPERQRRLDEYEIIDANQ